MDDGRAEVLCWVSILFGWDGLGEVPQLQGVVFRHGDQAGLHGVECQRPDAIEVAAQCVLRVPRLPERRLFTGRQLVGTHRDAEGRRGIVGFCPLRFLSQQNLNYFSYIIAKVRLVVGDGEVCQVPQTQHAFQHVVRPSQQEGLPPTGGER